jgi:hypothetical protein
MSEIDREELRVLRDLVTEAGLEQADQSALKPLLETAERGDEAAFEALLVQAERCGYHRPPGTDPAIPPGTLMVCPVDPAHYRRYRRDAAQVLRCPVHKKPLISDSKARP